MIGIIFCSFVVITLLIIGWDWWNGGKTDQVPDDEEQIHFYQDHFKNKN